MEHTPTRRFTQEQMNELKVIESKKGAAFIVRACNSHDELVEALRDAVRLLERDNVKSIGIGRIKQALLKAEALK